MANNYRLGRSEIGISDSFNPGEKNVSPVVMLGTTDRSDPNNKLF